MRKEIERKFLIKETPTHLKAGQLQLIQQGYLSIEPEVRIRSVHPKVGHKEYTLCIKGPGTLSRTEVDIEISQEQFEALKTLVPGTMMVKVFQNFWDDNGVAYECSIVDVGLCGEYWSYCEVEFNSEDEAKSFIVPTWLGTEITYVEGYKMKNYWQRNHAYLRGKEVV